MKLISTNDYVLETSKMGIESCSLNIHNSIIAIRFERVVNYAKFLNRPFELWMFAPCDKKGVFLEEPAMFKLLGETEEVLNSVEYKEYKLAKLAVLFEGWEVRRYNHRNEIYLKHKDSSRIINLNQKINIDDLKDKFNLVLNESAIKKLGI